jgi:phosphoribosyl 1,2-cyclic phosphate phosphodiesterase
VDDLRVFSMTSGQPVPAWGSRECVEEIRTRFGYVFDQQGAGPGGVERPEGELHILQPFQETEIAGFPIIPLPVPHGPVESWGFRTGDLGYITDAKELPERVRQELAGVRVLVLNALWFTAEHPTHFNVEEAVEVAGEIGAERTYLTHISHLASHRELQRRLPPRVFPAYDGLVVEI